MPLRRPILGLVPEGGAASTILTRHALGPVAPPSDPEAIADAIERLIDQGVDQLNVDPPLEFHRQRLTGQLATLMDEVVTSSMDTGGMKGSST